MNINRMLMLATAVVSLTANAQVKLDDKNANAYDLGYGVVISSAPLLQPQSQVKNCSRPRQLTLPRLSMDVCQV